MRIVFAFLLSSITITGIVLLNTRLGTYPPLGKFLDPIKGCWAEVSAYKAQKNVKIKGLQHTVKVYWDQEEIPHIFADSVRDMYFTQGYVSAKHRLWQMEYEVLRAKGARASLLGKDFYEKDRKQRRMGVPYAAELMCKEALNNPRTHSMLQAYSQGVNTYIRNLSYTNYPIEYKILDHKPTIWTPNKSCLIMKNLQAQHSLHEGDLLRTLLLQKLGPQHYDLLFPSRPSHPNYTPPVTSLDHLSKIETPSSFDTLHLPEQTHLSSVHLPTYGGSCVAISAQKSATDEVLLASGYDTELSLPAAWYLVHLSSKESQVIGASRPGLPGVLVGCNDSVAWAFSPTAQDTQDWYSITFTNPNRTEYVYDHQRHKSQIRIESFDIYDEPTKQDTVVYTHYGPVVYDRNFQLSATDTTVNLASTWTGYEPTNEMAFLHKISYVENYTQAARVFAKIQAPVQNICLGTAAGEIALVGQGELPLRFAGQGEFLMDGRSSLNNWRSTQSSTPMLEIRESPKGFLAATHHYPIDSSQQDYLPTYSVEYFRHLRLLERLEYMQNITYQDLMKLQNDNFNYVAYELLPMLLDSLDREVLSIEQSKIYEHLNRWDYFNAAHLKGPVYFECWLHNLYTALWKNVIPETALLRPSFAQTIYLIKSFHKLSAEERQLLALPYLSPLINETFYKTCQALATYTQESAKPLNWGAFKETTLQHVLGIKALGKRVIEEIGGGDFTVNATRKHSATTLRLVIRLSKSGPKIWAIYPGGQIGAPAHKASTAFVERWISGQYVPLSFTQDRKLLREEARYVQTLQATYP